MKPAISHFVVVGCHVYLDVREDEEVRRVSVESVYPYTKTIHTKFIRGFSLKHFKDLRKESETPSSLP